MSATPSVSSFPRGFKGYSLLLRTNTNVRRLWMGQVISDMGDWFNTVAVLGLLLKLTQSAAAGSLNVVLQMLPSALTALFLGGYIADRFDRKKVMIAADLSRAAIALLYLVVRTPDTVWLAFVATAGLSAGNAFFNPASAAALPNLCKREELATANALQQSTFSSIVFVGAFIGGAVTHWLGRDAAFVLNALSFVWSAFSISRVNGNFSERNGKTSLSGSSALRVLAEGALYLRANPRVLLFSLAKPTWSWTLGGVGLFSAYAFSVYQVGDIGTSWLYGGRGLGAFIGPLAFQSFVAPSSLQQFSLLIGGALLLCMTGYSIYGFSLTPFVGFIGLMIGHLGGGSVWAFSRIIVQRETPDNLRGRVLALDGVLFSMTTALATFALGIIANYSTPLIGVMSGVAVTFVLSLVWAYFAWRILWRKAVTSTVR
jgi:MFS family permease